MDAEMRPAQPIMPRVDPKVRAAQPDDPAPDLLYASAARYYDAYAGGEATARRLVSRVYARRGHAASFEICRVAVLDGEVVGVLAAFPAGRGEALARRFIRLSLLRLGPWRWPRVLRHLRAAARVSPHPPPASWYVDALAVAEGARRRGVATALLRAAEHDARAAGLPGMSVDTGLENAAARALYEGFGFRERERRALADERLAQAVGGRGFVGYFKVLE